MNFCFANKNFVLSSNTYLYSKTCLKNINWKIYFYIEIFSRNRRISIRALSSKSSISFNIHSMNYQITLEPKTIIILIVVSLVYRRINIKVIKFSFFTILFSHQSCLMYSSIVRRKISWWPCIISLIDFILSSVAIFHVCASGLEFVWKKILYKEKDIVQL